MKRSNWVRLIAVILVISMLAAPVSAAPIRGNDSETNSGVIGHLVGTIKDVLDNIFGGLVDEPGDEEPAAPQAPGKTGKPGKPAKPEKPAEPAKPAKPAKPGKPEKPTEPAKPEKPVKPVKPTNPVEPSDPEVETVLELIEGHNTVENGHLLRGVTYSLSQVISEQVELHGAPYAQRSTGVSTFALNSGAYNVQAADSGEVYTPVASITVDEIWAASNGTATATWYATPYYYNTGSAYFPVEINNYGSYYMVSYLNENGSRPSAPAGLGALNGTDAVTCLYTKSTGTNVVTINLELGDEHVITIEGDVSGSYSNSIVDVNTAVATQTTTTTSGNYVTPAMGLHNGSYLIINANQKYKNNNNAALVNTVASGNSNLKFSTVDLTSFDSNVIWNLNIAETADNGYLTATLTNGDGDYLAYSGTVKVVDTATNVTIEVGGDNQGSNSTAALQTAGWRVNLGGTYLNWTGSGAAVWTDKGDDGNHWYFYEVIQNTATTTTVTFTAAAVGETTVTIGGVTYSIHVSAAADPSDASRDIPVDVLTPTAGDQHNDAEGASKVLDNDNNSKWHTYWYGTNRDNHWIQFQLSEEYQVDGLRYLPRQDSSNNGNITQYEIQVSDDGQTFRTVATGTWENSKDWKLAQFDAVNAKYVRLVSKNSVSDSNSVFASAAEIRLTGVKVEQPEEPTTNLLYIPVTMFNYDMDTMNEKTISMYEEGSTLYSGIHFSNGTPASKDSVTYAVTAHTGEYTNGQYVIQNYLMKDYNQPSWLTCTLEGSKGITSTTNQADATIWTLTRRPGANVFTLTTEIDGTTYYMTMGNETSGVTTDYSEITLVHYTHTNSGIQITKDGYYLGHSEGNLFCGNTNSTSTSNGMGFFPVAEDGTIGDTARNVTTINGAVTSGFSRWNWWSYLDDGNSAQNKFFAELVQHELDENGDIVFNVIEPGIFKTGTGENIAQKDVYTNVGLPFVLDETTGIYSFDSDHNGVYFSDKDGDGDADPASGTETELERLVFEPGAPQGWPGMWYGDGSSQLWAPFNTNTNDNSEGNIDYHFGMRADIPFSMTPNGRIKSTDDNSTPITFTFSGDDDVWVFIDGHLVIDLGGIHNRIGATIDFANNTITYFLPESNVSTAELGCYNDRTRYPLNADGKTITVKLYNDAEGEGSLGQTRVNFASQEEHTMSIFYMERGKGTSNCHIDFNLPMRDTVQVTKDITKSWSEAQDNADGDGDGTAPLTAKEQAAVDKLDFYFKLWKKEANGELTVVANTNYFLQDKTGKVLGTFTTGADGKFSLKNGQTAKFMTEISNKGVTYYVEELDLDLTTFLTPDYNYAGLATNGFDYVGETLAGNGTETVRGHVSDASNIGEQELPVNAQVLKSYDVTAYGSMEAIDSLEFICTNYLNAALPNPTARAYEDIIVIDYGLDVQIDPLANDVYRGDALRILYWGDENLTLEAYKEAEQNGTLTAPKTAYHSGTLEFVPGVQNEEGVVRDTFIYKLNKQLTEVEVITYIIESASYTNNGQVLTDYSVGKIYIVPATIMYYEENFADMITFIDNKKVDADGNLVAKWDTENTVSNADNVSPFQEPGVVGTVDDSTYGSDVAYLSDNGDSNGTYRFADTTNAALQFTYDFTGTGTTIFARTSANTGYIQVKVYNADKSINELVYVDTYWKDKNNSNLDEDGTLYNIPVFTREDLPYDTYTVVCTIAKKGTPTNGNILGAGNEFYLDGIRVMQPLNEGGDAALTAKALGAYAADGESNLDTVTLREKLIYDKAQWDDEKFAVMTDIAGNMVSVEDYINIGPHEEVYLAPGQKVTFSLKTWYPEGLKLYMGMKAPFGQAEVNVGHEAIPLNNAPDCYYDVTNHYESLVPVTDAEGNITSYVVTYTFEGSESIVSLTNIKVVGNYEFVIVPKP